jgi:triacylglycerol lipase
MGEGMKLNHYRILAGVLSLSLAGCAVSAASTPQANAEPGSCIILLHGLGRSSMSMKGVQWRLEDEGYRVVNQGYDWIGERIEDIAPAAIGEGLAGCAELGATSVGFVTHSLGGILLRHYLQSQDIASLGRVVMLAPPNQGSVLADHLTGNGLLEPMLPEAAHQLGTGEDSVPRQLGPVTFELGVIAGTNSRPLLPQGLEEVANDGTVAVDETRVEGMQDFLVLPVDHSFLMWRDMVLDQVMLFLGEGHFDHSPLTGAAPAD